MSICDFLFSADVCVASAARTRDALVAQLGLPAPGPAAHVRYPDEGWEAIFALVSKSFSAAPTRLEVIAPLEGPGAVSAARKVFEAQAPRAWRSHATVVATPSLEAVVEHVRAAGVRHWLQPPADDVPFARLWIGVQPADIAEYDPRSDGGFRFEFIPSDSPAFMPRQFQPPVDEPRPGEAGFRRIRHRAFLVQDLDAALRQLETTFGWAPAHAVRDETGRGYRFAEMSANHAHGAALRLVQALHPESRAGRDLSMQGPGAYTITVAAFDLEATAADLERRGVAFERLDAGRAEPPSIVPVLADAGAPFAIVPDS